MIYLKLIKLIYLFDKRKITIIQLIYFINKLIKLINIGFEIL
jgi:hypothetical protein